MQDLGTLGGATGEATHINNSGQIVGGAADGSGNEKAFPYSGGSMQNLGTFGGLFSEALGINNIGQVVGKAAIGTGSYHAFLYSGGIMHDLNTLPGYTSASWAQGINDDGQIVGWARSSSFVEHAFLDDNGTMEDLNSLISANLGWTLMLAQAINDDGQICGYGSGPSGQSDAFLLTPMPTPEPSALALPGCRCPWPAWLQLAEAHGSEKNCKASGLRSSGIPRRRSTHPLFPLAFVLGERGTTGSLIERVEGPRF